MNKDYVGERIIELLHRKEKKVLTETEAAELEVYMGDPGVQLLSETFTEAHKKEGIEFMNSIDADDAWEKLPINKGVGKRKKLSFLKRFSMAAAMIVIITTACVYLFLRSSSEQKETANNFHQSIDIYPPEGKATLTLADGKVITLEDNQQRGVLTSQGGNAIRNQNNELVYEGGNAEGKLLYNTVSTADGASYKLVLADGTRVWLNTNSSIKFPVAFTGLDRKVTVTGEAYFEVAKDPSKPFMVSANEMNIQVLGTQFNVNAYPTEPSINTTLIQGSVVVKQATKQQVLKPGEQARIRSGSEKIEVTDKIDIDEVIGWQRDQFVFRGASLQNIMRRLQQYYGMEVEYRGNSNIQDATFVATFPRNEPVSRVLNVLEKTGMVHFEITDKKIIVKP